MIDEKKLLEELDKKLYAMQIVPMREVINIINVQPKVGEWIPCSDQMPNCCGYPVLLTVENIFGQRDVCKAFTNYMKEWKLLFYTNEKEYCSELTSSKLSNAWKPIAWMPLPEPYNPVMVRKQTNADRIRAMSDEELAEIILCPYDTAGKPIDIMPCVKDGNIQELVPPEDCKKCMLEWLQSEVEE